MGSGAADVEGVERLRDEEDAAGGGGLLVGLLALGRKRALRFGVVLGFGLGLGFALEAGEGAGRLLGVDAVGILEALAEPPGGMNLQGSSSRGGVTHRVWGLRLDNRCHELESGKRGKTTEVVVTLYEIACVCSCSKYSTPTATDVPLGDGKSTAAARTLAGFCSCLKGRKNAYSFLWSNGDADSLQRRRQQKHCRWNVVGMTVGVGFGRGALLRATFVDPEDLRARVSAHRIHI